jgi:ABC-type antimicrobial peptide transport system permease subunit
LGLGAVTILLAVVGIYGVVAFAVKQRTRELGIRVALGASGGRIVTLVLVSGLKPVGVGMMTGLLLALAASRVVERAFGNTGVPLDVTDPLTFLAGTLVLSAAAIAAMYGPARRAGRADPMQAIRHE